MEQFRHIGLIGRPGSATVVETLNYLIRYLQQQHLNVLLDADTGELLGHPGLQECNRATLGQTCDLVVVVGGDGSLLSAARSLARFQTPVLGINRGRLGFLTDIAPDEIDAKVGAVLAGNFRIEPRFLLEMETKDSKGTPTGDGLAMNDIVLHAGKSVHMIEFELFIEGEFVYRQRSDGLIIATPTGSTAYALAGGGPIMHPRLDAVVLVPMHPHTLSSRPIVVDGNSEIKIRICTDYLNPMVSCDGQSSLTVRTGEWISIRKYPHKLRLVHPPGHDFYEACRTKLGWSSPLGGD